MRQWAALNKPVPIEILADLVTDPDREVRYAVAMKRKLTRELFDILADDGVTAIAPRVLHVERRQTCPFRSQKDTFDASR